MADLRTYAMDICDEMHVSVISRYENLVDQFNNVGLVINNPELFGRFFIHDYHDRLSASLLNLRIEIGMYERMVNRLGLTSRRIPLLDDLELRLSWIPKGKVNENQ